MTRRSVVVTARALLGALAGLFLFAVWFFTFDGGGIRRGDLAYFVSIPAKVRYAD